jgi:hypothetical protein
MGLDESAGSASLARIVLSDDKPAVRHGRDVGKQVSDDPVVERLTVERAHEPLAVRARANVSNPCHRAQDKRTAASSRGHSAGERG